MTVGEQKIASVSYMVAAKKEGGDWKYLDGAGFRKNKDQLWTFFPDLPKDRRACPRTRSRCCQPRRRSRGALLRFLPPPLRWLTERVSSEGCVGFLLLFSLVLAVLRLPAGSRSGWKARMRIVEAVNPHGWYDSVKKEELSGGAWLSNFAKGDDRVGTAEYDLNIAKAGAYAVVAARQSGWRRSLR